MDDFMLVRFALDNVHPPEIALKAMEAFDRIVEGKAVGDAGSVDWTSYARARALPGPGDDPVPPGPVSAAGRWGGRERANSRPTKPSHRHSGP